MRNLILTAAILAAVFTMNSQAGTFGKPAQPDDSSTTPYGRPPQSTTQTFGTPSPSYDEILRRPPGYEVVPSTIYTPPGTTTYPENE